LKFHLEQIAVGFRDLIAIWLALTVSVLFAASSTAAPALPVINTNNIVNVTNFGATGDGETTNTTAIQEAIYAAAAGSATNGAAGGTVEFPAGIYLSGPLVLASSVNLQLDSGAILRMLPFGQYPVTWFTNGSDVYFTAQNFISASGLQDIEISGSGAIDGQGLPWWPWANTNNAVRPIMIAWSGCNRELIQNVTLSNSPMFHIAISGNSGNTTVQGVTVLAPSSSANPPSHNTDACDVAGTNILVENCNISTGDDDFTCGGGTSDVLLTNNTYGNGHGVSIGSYTDGGVSNITVINCTFNGTENGIRIKSDNDRGGLVQDISYLNLSMTNVEIPIQIYGYYNEVGTPNNITAQTAASEPLAAVTGTTPIYCNIMFSNITATSVSGNPVGIIWARTEMPATNIVFDKVNLTGYNNFCIYNVSGAQFIDSTINVSSSPTTFTLFDAQVIITNSAPNSAVSTFTGLTTNGYANGLAFYNALASLQNTNALGLNTAVTVAASTLTINNNLSINPSNTFNYVLGASAAEVAVGGNLVLGGTNTISAAAGFTNGTYTLMTYTGALSGSLPVLGSIPPGYYCALNTNTAGKVLLAVNFNPLAVPTTCAAQSSDNPSAFGAPVTLTAVISPAPTNGETVTFMDGANVLGGGALEGGQAAFITTPNQLAVGTHSITAVYAGDGTYEASTSAGLTQIVMPPPGTFFSDAFDASTVDSPSPATPTSTSASYEVLSGKSWSPMPSLAPGNLKFGIGSTSSGVIEIQAQFASPAITLGSPGDYVQLMVTFTNTAGILNQTGNWDFGLYNSGGVAPVEGGLNSTLSAADNTAATGGAQNWQGYFAQIGYTGSTSGFYERQKQAGAANNNQDVVTTGTSSSCENPDAMVIGTASTAPSLALAVGTQYTEVFTCTLTASGALQLANQLYTGAGAGGAPLSTMTATTATSLLTAIFDSLAFGWRAEGSTASEMTVSSISVTGQSTPPAIGYAFSGSTLTLNWPANYLGWLVQSNAVSLASSNWSTVPGSGGATNFSVAPDPATPAVFYRLIAP
jgi:polygalacturonase